MSQTIEKLTSLTFNGKFKVPILICFSSRRNSQPFDFPSTTLYTTNIREASFRTALPFHFPLNYPKRTPPPVHETSASENYISLLSDWLFFTNTIFFLMELVPCDYNSRQASHLDKKSPTLTKTFFTPLIPAIKTEQRIVRVALKLGGTGAPRRAGSAIDRRGIVDFSSTELRFRGGDSWNNGTSDFDSRWKTAPGFGGPLVEWFRGGPSPEGRNRVLGYGTYGFTWQDG